MRVWFLESIDYVDAINLLIILFEPVFLLNHRIVLFLLASGSFVSYWCRFALMPTTGNIGFFRYFLLSDQKKVTKEKSPANEKLPKILS
jgi:hypothetical protein